MKAALLSGSIDTALGYFVEGASDDYRSIFTQLGSKKIDSIFSGIVEMRLTSQMEYVAKCEAIRMESGGRFSYPVDFVKDQNGIWKIMGF